MEVTLLLGAENSVKQRNFHEQKIYILDLLREMDMAGANDIDKG